MPEETKTGKIVYPIIDASNMKKDGWFIRETNTKGVSVRLAILKSTNRTVVQAYIFDTKQGWDKEKAEKWLKKEDVKWIACLEGLDEPDINCCKIIMVIGEDDVPLFPKNDNEDNNDKKKNNSNKTLNKEEVSMSENIELVANDGSGLVPVKVDKNTGLPINVASTGLPTEIINVPKRIVTHRSKKKGSNGKPLNLNVKDYGKSLPSSLDSTEVSKDLNKCDTDKDDDKQKNACDTDKDKDKKMEKTVRTPKKK
jgi:hypothetical protein